MKLVQTVNVFTTINRHILEIRFTAFGKKLATWYDEGRDTHFITWKEGIIDALYDLTEEGEDDIRLRVNGEARRKDNRTEFLVDSWHLA